MPSDGRALFAQHRDDHGPFTGPNVALNVKDLLPSAEHEPAVAHGHRQARTEQRRLQVGMAVAVVPGLLVGVVPAGGNQAPQKRRQVLLQARLELNGADGSGATRVEDLHDACAYTRLADNASDRVGQVLHLAAAVRVQRQFSLEDHAVIIVDEWIARNYQSGMQGFKRVVQAVCRNSASGQEFLLLEVKRPSVSRSAERLAARCCSSAST